MYSSKGLSLVELIIVVGISGILTAAALPLYQDYVLRVHIVEALNEMSTLVRGAQIAFGKSGIKSPIDIEKLIKEIGGDSVNGSMESLDCTDGFEKRSIVIPKDKLGYIGVTSPYIYAVTLSVPCTKISSYDDSIEINVRLDRVALGIPNQGNQPTNSDYASDDNILLTISKEAIYQDIEGNITRKAVGSVLSCSIRPFSKFSVPISALPPMCHHYSSPGSSPHMFTELSGY